MGEEKRTIQVNEIALSGNCHKVRMLVSMPELPTLAI
jgi:hypothetical protein